MNRPANLVIGQEVFITRVSHSFGATRTNTLGKVSKVTPNGTLVVDVPAIGGGLTERRFTARDREIGRDDHFLSWNVEAIKADKIEETKLTNVAAHLDEVSTLAAGYNVRHGREQAAIRLAAIRVALEAAEAALRA